MSNIEIATPLVNGAEHSYHVYGDSCRDAVEFLVTDDFGAPPHSLNFTVQTETGRTVKLIIPYDHNGTATVLIDGEAV